MRKPFKTVSMRGLTQCIQRLDMAKTSRTMWRWFQSNSKQELPSNVSMQRNRVPKGRASVSTPIKWFLGETRKNGCPGNKNIENEVSHRSTAAASEKTCVKAHQDTKQTKKQTNIHTNIYKHLICIEMEDQILKLTQLCSAGHRHGSEA